MPRPKKKRKPKSQRGKHKKKDQTSSAVNEALDILGFSAPESDGPTQDETEEKRSDE